MPRVLKRRDFSRWQAREKIPDAVLCKAVNEMETGLIDADLGGCLYKKRIARSGFGKISGYRLLLSARLGERYLFVHGFSKSDKENITQDERRSLRHAARKYLELPSAELGEAFKQGMIEEVRCEQNHRVPAPGIRRAL
ncbi:type II toxin-antitoxin system RelE/ParE family toxin [Bacillus sp. NP157]|nr:type II toxin-antitoxin system RelE/ParE family toxin [Bacillus sp. NP157]